MNSKTDRIIKDLYRTIRQTDKKRTSGYDTVAEVTRVDGATVWVHIPGGVDETPVRMTMGAKKGDIVQVRVAGGSAWLIGNASAPPTDDTRANQIGDSVIYTQTLLADTIIANNARFNYIEADTAKIHHLEADELEASVAYIHDLTADNITVQDLYATTGYIKDLAADNITAANIIADHAAINTLDANYAHITNGVIDNAKIGYADVNDLNAHYAHISQGVIDNAKIGYADVNDLNAHYAQVDAANIDTAAIRNAWIDELMVQTGLIAHEGTVYELDAIQVNASKIKAGTLDVERLIVTVSGQKYLVHIDPSTGTPSYEKLDGDVIEDLTITADKIVAGAITAEKITTENIVGSGGWINLRNGTFQYTNATSGEGIAWDGTHLTITGSVTILNSNYYTKTEADNLLSAKRQVFTSQPTTAQAYAVGDLWVNATYGTTYTNDILRCKTAKASGTAFNISHWEKASKYTDDSNVYTKSDFSITPSAIISKVNANELNLSSTYAVCNTGASTTAKVATITPSVTGWALYTGASINVKFANNNTATAPTLNVNSTGAKRIYAYTGTSALTEAEYKWKAGDTITFFYDGTYWRIQDSTKLTRMSTAETSITQTANSITSLASNTSTYTKPDGTTGTNSMYTAINQNAQSITTLIGRADEVDTLIRAYSSGVLVGKTSQAIGALVNAGGSFDVVPVSWSGSTPTVGSSPYASFGTFTRVGLLSGSHIELGSSNGMNVFDQDGLLRMNASSTGISVFDYEENDTTPINVAQFGKTARLGARESNRFVMNANSLQAYDSNNYKYFEVSANGITYGSKTVANTDDVDEAEDNAKKVATNYLYYDSSVGLKIAQSNPSTATTNYIQIASNGMKTALDANNYSVVTSSGFDIHKGGNSVALFGDTARLGAIANNTSRLYLTSSSMSFIDRDGSGTDLYRLQITNTGMNVFDQGGLLRLNASTTGLSVFDYDENDNRVNVAQFSNTARIGIDQKSRVVVNNSGSYFYDDENNLGTAIMPGTIWIGKTGESSMQISGKTISLLTDGSARMLYVNGENGATQLGNNQEAFVQTYGDTITFKSGNYSAVPFKVYSHGVTSSTLAKTYIQTVVVSNPLEGLGRFYQSAYSFAAPSDIDTISAVSVKIDSGSTTRVTATLNQQTVTIASGQDVFTFPLQPPNQSYTVTIYLVYIPKASGAANAVLMADSKVLVDWDGKITAPYLSITGDVATNLKMATGTNIILPTGYSIGTYRDASDTSSWMALIYGTANGEIHIGNEKATNIIASTQLTIPKGQYLMSGGRIVCGISQNNTYMYGYGSRNSSEGASYFDGHVVNVRSNGNITFTAGTSGTISGNKAYTNTSDIRLKTDIESLDTDDIILNLKPFKFHWKDAESYDHDDHYGVSAQDLKELLEKKGIGGIVSKTDEYLGVAYTELIPMLIHLCQSQQREIDTLKDKVS